MIQYYKTRSRIRLERLTVHVFECLFALSANWTEALNIDKQHTARLPLKQQNKKSNAKLSVDICNNSASAIIRQKKTTGSG